MDQRSNESPGCRSPGGIPTSSSPVFSSELARAICGYLSSVGCPESRSSFINEYSDLKEFNGLVQRGLIRTVDSNIEGMELLDIVNDYVMMKRELDYLVHQVFPGGDSGLLRSDGPLRKLKVLGSKFTEVSSPRNSKSNDASNITQENVVKTGDNHITEGLTANILNRSMPSLQSTKITQQSRTMKLCEEIKIKDKQRKMELAAAAEVKATEEEIEKNNEIPFKNMKIIDLTTL